MCHLNLQRLVAIDLLYDTTADFPVGCSAQGIKWRTQRKGIIDEMPAHRLACLRPRLEKE
jgi:hypothetical protein